MINIFLEIFPHLTLFDLCCELLYSEISLMYISPSESRLLCLLSRSYLFEAEAFDILASMFLVFLFVS